jgi:2,4-dienoyl-CoA reductase-like NADH-dependent reductase (Old Yellow Enzyme family)
MPAAFPTLFSPFRLGRRDLRNRIGFPAMSCRLASGGRASAAMGDLLEARAAGGAALIITEALAAAPSAAVASRISAFDEAALPGLAGLAEAVTRQGALPIGQLWHPGSANRGQRALDAVGASAVADGMSWTVPRVLEPAEIEALIADYAASAHRLERAGFAGVEVSAAHGFLPLQFLSRVSNRRSDDWGGSLANRSRFLREILRAIRAACGPEFLMGLKLPADDGIPGSVDPEEAARITAAVVADTPPDWLCYSQGSHGWSLAMHSPDAHEPLAPYRALWRAMRPAAGGVPIAAVGRIADPATAEDILASGDADLVMLARPLLADPQWPAKAAASQAGSIRPCLHCNVCWGEINRGNPMACSVNPLAGSGREMRPAAPAAAPRHVVVVGTGVAGLQAALTAARRGHRVTLLGGPGGGAAGNSRLGGGAGNRRLGGAAALAAELPGGEGVRQFLDWLRREAADAGIAFRPAAPAVEAVLALRPDAVVLASGAAMSLPDGFTDDGTGRDLRSLLAEGVPARGGLAVLFDHDHTQATYDAAELLAQRFERLVLATPREGIAQDMPTLSAQGVHRRLAALKVTILPYRRPVSHQGGVVLLQHLLTGEEEVLAPAALFAWSTPRVPRHALLAPLRAAGVAVHLAGDALAPRLMLSAIREGDAVGEAL